MDKQTLIQDYIDLHPTRDVEELREVLEKKTREELVALFIDFGLKW